jgi:hypothetical protein
MRRFPHPVALADPAHFIRTTAASVLDWLYRGVGPDHWPEALDRLLQMAESDNRFAQEVQKLRSHSVYYQRFH